MAVIPTISCPTLDAADRALEAAQERRTRPYLGMSEIGNACARALWYRFRWAGLANFDAATLKRFADGHATEAVAVARLKAVDELEVHEADADGEQFGFKDLGGHFSGHMDGVILGLRQAPATWHVLEIKACADKKLAELEKAKREVGEKLALRAWNPTYYAQAVLYMAYAGLDRHYLVACSPGARAWTAVRTNADPAEAEVLKAKAERIIFSDRAPSRIGDVTSFACRWCDFADICHRGAHALRNCRTCMNVTAMREGGWRCEKYRAPLLIDEQRAGCPDHRFNPELVAGEQIDVHGDAIIYRKVDGELWADAGE